MRTKKGKKKYVWDNRLVLGNDMLQRTGQGLGKEREEERRKPKEERRIARRREAKEDRR